jgi:hypothetical protein
LSSANAPIASLLRRLEFDAATVVAPTAGRSRITVPTLAVPVRYYFLFAIRLPN